jgi:hypothetical protein
MYLGKFVHSTTGRIVMSIILGLGLATLFRSVCIGKRCKIFASPPMTEIVNQTYRFDQKCYKMEKHAVKCDKTKTIVKI